MLIRSRRLEGPGHDLARQPGRGVESRCGPEVRQPVDTADPPASRQPAAESVADDRPHRVGIAEFPPGLPGAVVADGYGPFIEQVAAHRRLVAAVVVLL